MIKYQKGQIQKNHKNANINNYYDLDQDKYEYNDKLSSKKQSNSNNLNLVYQQILQSPINFTPKGCLMKKHKNIETLFPPPKLNAQMQEFLSKPFNGLKPIERRNNISQVILSRTYQALAQIFLLQMIQSTPPILKLLRRKVQQVTISQI